MDNLKNCPFCNKKSQLEEVAGKVDGVRFSAGCEDENCIGFMYYKTFATRKEAIEAYNTRPEPTEAEVERAASAFRAELKKLGVFDNNEGLAAELLMEFNAEHYCAVILKAALMAAREVK